MQHWDSVVRSFMMESFAKALIRPTLLTEGKKHIIVFEVSYSSITKNSLVCRMLQTKSYLAVLLGCFN